jgi:SAM-dependent methyltransferase
VDFGSLRRVVPISREWGYDRGTPIDRYYIDQFLKEHQDDVRGRVLEFGDARYTRRFGGAAVSSSDVMHVDEGNPDATIVGDLTIAHEPALPSNAFDCIILTQTLQLLYELDIAIANLHRALKPGGILLATAPGVCTVQAGADNWGDNLCWAFTTTSIRRLLTEAFGSSNVEARSYGNVLAATAFLHGIANEELEIVELETFDSTYPLVVAVCAVKR